MLLALDALKPPQDRAGLKGAYLDHNDTAGRHQPAMLVTLLGSPMPMPEIAFRTVSLT